MPDAGLPAPAAQARRNRTSRNKKKKKLRIVWRYRTPRGEFIPANFDRVSDGPISFREALGNSLNLSAVHLLLRMPDTYDDTLAGLHLINHPEFTPEHYGLGLVGNPEVSLLQLAAAYACLANGGRFAPLRFTPDAPKEDGTPASFSQAAFIISDILSDPMARVFHLGWFLAMNPPYRMAIKTGTSTHFRDLWAVAYTPDYTLAVWVGNSTAGPPRDSAAPAPPPPLWQTWPRPVPRESAAGLQEAARGRQRRGVRLLRLQSGPGRLHRRQELFMAGTEPQAVCSYHQPQDPLAPHARQLCRLAPSALRERRRRPISPGRF